ncbi:MAG: hybrid sensor histidine kinase/response regulator, partial [Kiritimatiellae bacterium]|nr:hybrid sensor histidine kinase/response regulator [Kiritimatiellia bacterium]
KGVELVNRTAKVPILFLDGHRFRQILFNLVGNAVKFTERGSVTVSASYDMETLEVSVSDTGCGIAPDRLASVLDPFAQAHEQGRAADFSAGTGLGLYICKCLVEAMGGRLAVESVLGKGSSFMIRIPNVIAVGEASRA